MRKIVFPLLAGTVLIAGCATTEPSATPEATPGAAPQSQPQARGTQSPAPAGQARAPQPKGEAKGDTRDALAKRSVYYEFDGYDVKPEYRPLVTAHAQYLRDNQAARIVIEGNSDERGSREYNVALGQRRAESVMKLMLLLGARANQIEAVSFGEEKPQASGQDEAAWTQNRRSDLVSR